MAGPLFDLVSKPGFGPRSGFKELWIETIDYDDSIELYTGSLCSESYYQLRRTYDLLNSYEQVFADKIFWIHF